MVVAVLAINVVFIIAVVVMMFLLTKPRTKTATTLLMETLKFVYTGPSV